MKVRKKEVFFGFIIAIASLLFLYSTPSYAKGAVSSEEYRTFFGIDPRLVIWIIAELHLMLGAFVLGVPIFAVTIEAIGAKTGEKRFDDLAHEFIKLLSAAFSTTAALGGLFAFALYGLYPTFMSYLTGIFHYSMYIYALLFFAEAFTLYIYYYSWDRMQNRKWLHVSLGVLLNVFGVIIMVIPNSWATYMMSPTGVDVETGKFVGTLWQAVNNPLWMPINIHRFISNISFGGIICGAYAAFKFLGAKTAEEKAHYDWMGYIGNFVGIAALIPLPFAGYFLGREIYSYSAVMGNNMMGGAFSWTFIIQAILIGNLFIGSNYYLWIGMQRIEGAERYSHYIKWLIVILFLCFIIWLTPHNLPLSPKEAMEMGGQYHPTLKYLGLMSAKNAVVNFIILATFVSFLLYRRGNKGKIVPISQQGNSSKIIISLAALFCIYLLGNYALYVWKLDPLSLDLTPDKAKYFKLPLMLLLIQIAAVLGAVLLTFKGKGIFAQWLYLGITVINVTFVLGVYGFVIMASASAFLRSIAVIQVLSVITALTLVTTIDIYLFKGAAEVGRINWGKMPERSQYTLIFICVSIVLLMGLMGFIRSGLREDWHIYGILRDTSDSAFTPDNFYMAKVVSLCTIIFLSLVSFVCWLMGLTVKKKVNS